MRFLLQSVVGLLLLTSVLHGAEGNEDVRYFPAAIPVGSEFPTTIADPNSATIVVRYLGYECSHCVRQIRYLNEYASSLRTLGIRVVAVSEDPASRWTDLVRTFSLDTTVFRYIPDEDGSVARTLGAIREDQDTVFDLHATIVVRQGNVEFSVISTEPFMEIERVVAKAIPVRADVAPNMIDRYLSASPSITTIVSANDGLRAPLDLDFNRSALNPTDLWIVTAEPRGHAITIVHNAGTPQQVIRQKKDSRASHFMWRTMGIAMGNNGAFGTAQNGEPGGGDAEYMFMGPTLWSSDTAVFASRYQESNQHLASHLDMLHQSPWCLGIAHDTANVYWVLDGKYLDVCRYDFRDPHEVGGTDHRDGIIRRYTDVRISRGERNRPSHVALDRAQGKLYFVNPGAASIERLDTRSGTIGEELSMPASSEENVTEFTSVVGASVKSVVSAGLVEPVGIEVFGNRLLVGDRATGRIHIYAILDTGVVALGFVATGATELLGIVVGPDGKIWFTDRANALVGRLDLSADATLVAATPVRSIKPVDTVRFTYRNGQRAARTPAVQWQLRKRSDGQTLPWSAPITLPTLGSLEEYTIEVPIAITDSTSVWDIECAEKLDDGSMGVSARCVLVPNNVRRAVVNDETYGTFDIAQAVSQTDRVGYVYLTSDVFNVVASDLGHLKTVLWNGGSFGELDMVDDAVLAQLQKRGIEVFLIADDPLLLRTDLPNSLNFFRGFGCSMRGVDQIENDRGQRVFAGVAGDPVSAGMSAIDAQLPRLDHHRGGNYVPNVTFALAAPGSAAVITRSAGSVIGAVRYETPAYRSIVLGINASRFLDGEQRTTLLDRGLAWLEEAANPDTIPEDPTSVNENRSPLARIELSQHPVVSNTVWSVAGLPADHVTCNLYTMAGQLLTELYSGPGDNARGTLHGVNMPAGLYFLVVRSSQEVLYRTFIKK